MKYTQAKQGRIFVVRLEDQEVVHETLENFALDHSIRSAALIAMGGISADSRLVAGPKDEQARPIQPIEQILTNVHEIIGIGTLFPGENGRPVLHMHMSCGRDDKSITGCVRKKVKAWQIMEVILLEMLEADASRLKNTYLGAELLEPRNTHFND